MTTERLRLADPPTGRVSTTCTRHEQCSAAVQCYHNLTQQHYDIILAYRPEETAAVAMQRRGKHASITIELLLKTVSSTRSVKRGYKKDNGGDPCGGGVEYLHRSPASRRRRRKGDPVPEVGGVSNVRE
jgi:hypothetical protein